MASSLPTDIGISHRFLTFPRRKVGRVPPPIGGGDPPRAYRAFCPGSEERVTSAYARRFFAFSASVGVEGSAKRIFAFVRENLYQSRSLSKSAPQCLCTRVIVCNAYAKRLLPSPNELDLFAVRFYAFGANVSICSTGTYARIAEIIWFSDKATRHTNIDRESK